MTWRILLGKLSFPLLVGVSLLWVASAGMSKLQANQERATDAKVIAAVKAQAHVDAVQIEAAAHLAEVSGCHLSDYAFDPDGRQLMLTRLRCNEGEVVIHGALPRVAISRKGRVTTW